MYQHLDHQFTTTMRIHMMSPWYAMVSRDANRDIRSGIITIKVHFGFCLIALFFSPYSYSSMAVANWLWSWVWKSPLKGKLNDIEMRRLRADTILGEGSFGVMTQLVDAEGKVYAGKKLREDVLMNGVSKNAILEKFPSISIQMCSVKHANILRMRGVFFHDSVSFLPTLVYELEIRAETLERFLRTNRPEADKLTILQHIANGLKHLHGQNPPILHLNLTAANVFISRDPRLVAKIADAGVTILMNAGLADCSLIAPRTRDHLPPEESFSDFNASIDVFSYGVLIDQVLLQEQDLKSVPIFRKRPGGDIVLDNEDFTRKHVWHLKCLETHPLYPTLQHCLMKHSSERPSAAALNEQMHNQVSWGQLHGFVMWVARKIGCVPLFSLCYKIRGA